MVHKASKAALPKFLDTLTLSQPGRGADYAHPLALLASNNSLITPLRPLISDWSNQFGIGD